MRLLLLGLGLTEFSLPSSAILEIKRVFRNVTLQQCREMAATAMQMQSAHEIDTYLKEELRSSCRSWPRSGPPLVMLECGRNASGPFESKRQKPLRAAQGPTTTVSIPPAPSHARVTRRRLERTMTGETTVK